VSGREPSVVSRPPVAVSFCKVIAQASTSSGVTTFIFISSLIVNKLLCFLHLLSARTPLPV
jgi:hypothetical protein